MCEGSAILPSQHHLPQTMQSCAHLVCLDLHGSLTHRRRKPTFRERKAYDTSVRAFSPDGSIYQASETAALAPLPCLKWSWSTSVGDCLPRRGGPDNSASLPSSGFGLSSMEYSYHSLSLFVSFPTCCESLANS